MVTYLKNYEIKWIENDLPEQEQIQTQNQNIDNSSLMTTATLGQKGSVDQLSKSSVLLIFQK